MDIFRGKDQLLRSVHLDEVKVSSLPAHNTSLKTPMLFRPRRTFRASNIRIGCQCSQGMDGISISGVTVEFRSCIINNFPDLLLCIEYICFTVENIGFITGMTDNSLFSISSGLVIQEAFDLNPLA